jgi:hypothetical protein
MPDTPQYELLIRPFGEEAPPARLAVVMTPAKLAAVKRALVKRPRRENTSKLPSGFISLAEAHRRTGMAATTLTQAIRLGVLRAYCGRCVEPLKGGTHPEISRKWELCLARNPAGGTWGRFPNGQRRLRVMVKPSDLARVTPDPLKVKAAKTRWKPSA